MNDAHTDGLPGTIDASVPHSARIWNYWLGGQDNFPADREAGDAYRESFPGIEDLARTARHFLARTIRHLAGDAGVRQFLDVGTGLPTVDNTHEVAQRVAPESRIVYVDNDPLVLVHANALLTSHPDGVTDYISADLHDPAAILAGARETLDLTQPVALILSGVMGHVADDGEARETVQQLMAGLPSGSYLSHSDGVDENPENTAAQDDYNDSGAIPYVLRTPERLLTFYDGLEFVDPGLVRVTHWRPETDPALAPVVAQFGAVARKP
ncbi:SAM-dependent methyltransferase [Streptomyces sp. N2-109]|uniref:SAM-dependent methyltransferase n=1 Tax=Streptomyces gossypii TaxID=2883101 RepID=A0ABT2JNI2_9ACTN|nr:SAM-dependent methyltransferase [Streptomyces gossypii]MCT2589433.1 SAM-dependent methyltransferase [Streptomyces gossypii]